nr:hypothetical protein [Antarcticimicrobium sediminis]
MNTIKDTDYSRAWTDLGRCLPALTIAGASHKKDDLTFMTETINLGSVSMRSFVFHAA